MAMTEQGLSASADDKLLKVARTIVDLRERDTLLSERVAESIQYRCLGRNIW